MSESEAALPAAPPARSTAWAGIALAALSSASFSIAPPLGTALIRLGLDPNLLLAVRFTIASLLIAGWLRTTAPHTLRIDRRGLAIAGGAGLANGVSMLLFFWALKRLDTSVASMLFSLFPLSVLGLLALRGERFTASNAFRLLLGLAGVYMLIGPSGQVDLVGALMVLTCVFLGSFQVVWFQWYLQGYDSRTITLYTVLGMNVTIVAWWLLQGAQWRAPGWQGWAGILAMAVFSTYLARVAMFAAVKRLGSGQVALLVPVETLLTIIIAILFLGDRPLLSHWLGGALILTSAALASTTKMGPVSGLTPGSTGSNVRR
jgi:drug/metabolite transporter (DMT)-like permease